jgi:putative methionine-R-sulfoxide reductase with GAF domain
MGDLAKVLTYLVEATWFRVFACIVVVVYLGVLFWKILSSEEGFLFGYGDWVVGKWQKVTRKGGPRLELAESSLRPSYHKHQLDIASMEREKQLTDHVLRLSRLLDGDLAYLMMHDADEWETKIMRALQTLVSGVTRVVHPSGTCRCGFFILADEGEALDLVAGEGYAGMSRPQLALDRSCAGRAFQTGEYYYCRDIASDPVYWHSDRGNRDYRSIACVPVRAGQVVFGVICLDATEVNAFTPDDFAHLEVFAAKLAVFCAFHTLQVTGVACQVRPEGGD